MRGPHPSHKTRFSDASTFDEICIYCGATDESPGGWGELADPCPHEHDFNGPQGLVDGEPKLVCITCKQAFPWDADSAAMDCE